MRIPKLLLAIFVATTFAAPANHEQVPFQADSPSTVTRARPNHDVLKTPFVVKGPPPPRGPSGGSPKVHNTTPAKPHKSYFGAKWTRPGEKKKKKEKTAPTSCFCAGGSICCHAGDGLSCDYGVCGI